MNKLYTLIIAGYLALSANAAFAQSQNTVADGAASPTTGPTALVYLGKEKRTVTFPTVKRTEWKGDQADSKFDSNSQ